MFEASKVLKVLEFEREEGMPEAGSLGRAIDHPVSGFGRSHPSGGGELRLSSEIQFLKL